MTAEEAAGTFADIAPAAPPCFESRRQWVAWLVAAQDENRNRHDRWAPLKRHNGKVAFNYQISYCDDCTREHRSAMLKEGRCNPEHLRALATEAVS